jgi:hypothetical protein
MSIASSRFFYGFGYKTIEAAQAALEDCYATGEISQAEEPAIVTYVTKKGRRYGIKING